MKFICKNCGKEFFFKKNFNNHKKLCKSSKKKDEKQHFCLYCDATFINHNDLMKHFIDHQNF